MSEKLVSLKTAAKRLGVGVTKASALKVACEVKGRGVFVSELRGYREAHPEFTVKSVFTGRLRPRTKTPPPRPEPATAGSAGE